MRRALLVPSDLFWVPMLLLLHSRSYGIQNGAATASLLLIRLIEQRAVFLS
jgi:hypothetical protein